MSHNDLVGRVGSESERRTVDRKVDTPDASVEDAETVLSMHGLTRQYGVEQAVQDISLSVRDGELLTLLGPSGCGKTTLLRLLAGLEQPSAGEVRIGGETVASGDGDRFVPAEQRDVGLVFQDFALFPHLTVEENIAFGIDDWSTTRREARIDELLVLVDLEEHREKAPEALSGGQQQRVAIARTLLQNPQVLIADEPVASLDPRAGRAVMELLIDIVRERGMTVLCSLHQLELASEYGDRVVGMKAGRIELDSPRQSIGRASMSGLYEGVVRVDHAPSDIGVAKAARSA